MNSVLDQFKTMYESILSAKTPSQSNDEFLASLDEKSREFIKVYETVKGLEEKNAQIIDKQSKGYEDDSKRVREMQEYLTYPRYLGYCNNEVAGLREQIDQLVDRQEKLNGKITEFSNAGAPLTKLKEALETKKKDGTITETEKEELRQLTRSCNFINTSKLESEKEVSSVENELETLRAKYRAYINGIKETNARQTQIRENEKNGYVNLDAKKADEEALGKNNAAINQSVARLNELSGKKKDDKEEKKGGPSTGSTDMTGFGDSRGLSLSDHLSNLGNGIKTGLSNLGKKIKEGRERHKVKAVKTLDDKDFEKRMIIFGCILGIAAVIPPLGGITTPIGLAGMWVAYRRHEAFMKGEDEKGGKTK